MLARVLESAEDDQRLEDRVQDALATLKRRSLERRGRELRAMLAEADRRGDAEAVVRLTREKMEVDQRLRGTGAGTRAS